jgi:uncharacterized protein YkwD
MVILSHSRIAALAALAVPAALLAFAVSPTVHGSISTASAEPVTVNCSVDSAQLTLGPEERAVLDETNAYRTAHGLSSLQLSYALTVNAAWKASDMASRHYDTHDDGFRTWDQRFRDCGYDEPGAWMGENLAGGNPAAADTLAQWEASPHHNENLLQPNFSAIGIKRVKSPDPSDIHVWYWAMELGGAIDGGLSTALTDCSQ